MVSECVAVVSVCPRLNLTRAVTFLYKSMSRNVLTADMGVSAVLHYLVMCVTKHLQSKNIIPISTDL